MTPLEHAFEDWKRRAGERNILDVALGPIVKATLKQKSRFEWAGPCPRCGGDDRFSINTRKRVFYCRSSDSGGGVTGMVMHGCKVDFLEACELLTGEAPPNADSVVDVDKLARERAARDAKAAAEAAERDRLENEYRQSERANVFQIFTGAAGFAGSSAERYYRLRGLILPPTPEGHVDRVKCVERQPYYVQGGGRGSVIHRGPAKLVPIVDASRKFRGLHFTYLDLDQPKGKLVLEHPPGSGDYVDAKKVRGSSRGYFCDLAGGKTPARLVVGEGDEKTYAVLDAETHDCTREVGDTAYWSAINLNNLAGKALATVAHPTLKNKGGRPQRVGGPDPDPDDAGLPIPDSVEELILLGDTTSDAFTTWCAMARAARRYARPGRRVVVAWAPPGADFDDLLRNVQINTTGKTREFQQAVFDARGRAAALAEIRQLVDGAGEIAPTFEAHVAAGYAAADDAATSGMVAAPARRSAAADRAPAAGTSGRLPAAGPSESSSGARGSGVPSTAARASAAAAHDPHPPISSASAAPLSVAAEKAPSSQTGGSSNKGGGKGGGPGGDGPPPGMKNDDELNRRLAYLPQTDLGNVERFVARWGHLLRWCGATGWYFYDGKRWSTRGVEGFIIRAEHATVRAIQDEAKACEGWAGDFVPMIEPPKAANDDNVVDLGAQRQKKETAAARKKRTKALGELAASLKKWGRKSEGSRAMMAQSKHAKGMLEIQLDELDTDPWKINVSNGTLHVRRPTSESDEGPLITLHPHDPADLITKISPVAYDPDATSPEFDKFFLRVQPDEAQRRMLLQWVGYSLTGDTGEQKLFVYWGKGRNGKGVFVETTAYIAGNYADSVPIETFLSDGSQRTGSGPTPDLAKLPGVRYLRCGEPQKGAKFNEALIKRATGGDPIDARQLNKPMITFFPQFSLTISCNYKPKIGGTDEGIWGRLQLVPWLTFIPKEERDPQLGVRMRTHEASGILNRMLAGLVDYLTLGHLFISKQSEDATAKYRSDSDFLGRFLEDCTEVAPDGRAQSSVVHKVYLAWAKCNGGTEYSNKGLTDALTDRGLETKKSGAMFFLGIKLTKSVNDFVDHLGEPLTQGQKSQSDQPGERGGDDDLTF